LKNTLYFIILFGSLGICATLAFRPQAADHALSFLGLKREESAELFPTSKFADQNFTSDSILETEGNAVSGSASGLASPYSAAQNIARDSAPAFHDMPSMFGTFPQQSETTPPVFNNPSHNNAVGSVSLEPQHGIGFGDYAGISIPDISATRVHSNDDHFRDNHSNNDGFATSHGAELLNDSPSGNVVLETNTPAAFADLSTLPSSVGFADFHAAQNSETHNTEDGFASSNSREIESPTYQQNVFDAQNNANLQSVPVLDLSKTQMAGVTIGDHLLANASVVMPDPQNNAEFKNPPPVFPANYEYLVNNTTETELVNIPVQANIPQTQMSLNPTPSSNVPLADVLQLPVLQNHFPQNYVSQQPQAIPQAPPSQFEIPQFITPQVSPQIALSPVNDDSPQIVAMQTPQRQSTNNLLASSIQNSAATNPRAQYEPDILAEFQTVFGAKPLARVGSDIFIQTCDILPDLKEQIDFQWPLICRDVYKQNHRTPTANEERQFKAKTIQEEIERSLDFRIEVALMYHDMTLHLPQEQIDQLVRQIGNDFDMKMIPELMKQYQATNRYDLDRELQKHGTFLERKRKNYIENQMGIGWFGSKLKSQNTVLTYDHIKDYYAAHKEDKYKRLGNVKWEELVVLFSRTASEQEAYAKIVELGNRVLKGESFAAAAKQGSHGLTASLGGTREIPLERGSLIAQQVEQAAFQLPVGKLSTIIREQDGFYIVRVTERIENSYTPLDKVLNEIKTSIVKERSEKEREEILADLRKKYPVVKTNELRNIIEMAAKVELNTPIDESESRYMALLARAEQIAPEKKSAEQLSRQPQQMLAAQSHPVNVNDINGNQATMAAQRDVPQTLETKSKQQPTEKEPEKKKSLLSSLNPFR
jgi:hypothetical protein